ncbi:hypothetical protein CCAN2_1970049 [Capnocytophaga canimorsus]|nr:hypothetical protein [Capnocytophaga canimorsus]CEN49273.1 hypothetical protein CCAN2_1970049 [Capnocytophaga canimorsus]
MDRKQLLDTLTQITLENKTFAEALLLNPKQNSTIAPMMILGVFWNVSNT